MNPEAYAFIGALLRRRSGLVLAPGKQILLESRLTPLMRERGLDTLSELVRELQREACEALEAEVTEAMTINETFFFRDHASFELLRRRAIPALLESRSEGRTLRVWCAACSSGQEAYSLAILLAEMADRFVGWTVEIVATDICRDVLEKARFGMYSQFEVQRGMPIRLLVKHFTQVGEMWHIDAGVRARVDFCRHNLLEDFSHLGAFDIVLCRNVLVYFEQETKRRILERLSSLIAPDGYLFLGAAETVLGGCGAFAPVDGVKGVYAPGLHTAGLADSNVVAFSERQAV